MGSNSGPKRARDTSHRIAVAVVLTVASLLVFGGAFVFAGGMQLVDDLLAGRTGAGVPSSAQQPSTATKPAAVAPGTAHAAETSAAPASSASTVGAAAAPAAAAKATAKQSKVLRAGGPDPRAQARMYYEQLASQVLINELASGRFGSITVSNPSKGADSATLRVRANYRGGASIPGTMGLRRFGTGWFFTFIVRDGNTQGSPSRPGGVDAGVVHTITAQQAAYQSVITGLLDGGYTRITLGTPAGGSGTKTIPITLSGGTRASRAGSIVMISKVSGSRTYWFIASLR